MRKYAFILFICSFFHVTAQAQRADMVFKSENGAVFQLFVDGLLESDAPDSIITVRNMPVGEHFVKVVFNSRNFVSFDEKIDIKKEGVYRFLISPKDPENPRWFTIEEVSFEKNQSLAPVEKPTQKPIEQPTPPTPPAEDTVSKPIEALDTAQHPPALPLDTIPMTPPLAEEDSSAKATDICDRPLDPRKLLEFSNRIKTLSFDDKKLSLAKDFASSHCFTAIQVMETMQLFDFEETRLDFAKFAYSRCFDPNNYLFVEDILEFEASKIELREQFDYRRK